MDTRLTVLLTLIDPVSAHRDLDPNRTGGNAGAEARKVTHLKKTFTLPFLPTNGLLLELNEPGVPEHFEVEKLTWNQGQPDQLQCTTIVFPNSPEEYQAALTELRGNGWDTFTP